MEYVNAPRNHVVTGEALNALRCVETAVNFTATYSVLAAPASRAKGSKTRRKRRTSKRAAAKVSIIDDTLFVLPFLLRRLCTGKALLYVLCLFCSV